MHEVGGSSPLVSTIDGAALFCRCAAPTALTWNCRLCPTTAEIKPHPRLLFLLILPARFLFLAHLFTSYLTSSLFTITYNLFSGALAQLGAHNTGSVGVRGSSPLCSTTQKSTSKEVLFCFISDNF